MFGVSNNDTVPYMFVVIFISSCCLFVQCNRTINVPVAVSGLGAYFLDGNSFLSKLCRCTNEEEKNTKTIKYDLSF